MDDSTTLCQLKAIVEDFVQCRNWESYHDPKNLSMALAVEASELMDIFKWCHGGECIDIMKDEKTVKAVKDELADIVILSLASANRHNIDLAEAVKSKVVKNNTRYPIVG